jgi:hypothetical protein
MNVVLETIGLFHSECRVHWRHRETYCLKLLYLQIEANVKFSKTTIRELVDLRLKFDLDLERAYSLAAKHNDSAAASLEEYLGRKPFWVEKKRIHVGRKWQWKGDWVTCTSIKDGDNPYLFACSYKSQEEKIAREVMHAIAGEDRPNRENEAQIKNRWKITHADLKILENANEQGN